MINKETDDKKELHENESESDIDENEQKEYNNNIDENIKNLFNDYLELKNKKNPEYHRLVEEARREYVNFLETINRERDIKKLIKKPKSKQDKSKDKKNKEKNKKKIMDKKKKKKKGKKTTFLTDESYQTEVLKEDKFQDTSIKYFYQEKLQKEFGKSNLNLENLIKNTIQLTFDFDNSMLSYINKKKLSSIHNRNLEKKIKQNIKNKNSNSSRRVQNNSNSNDNIDNNNYYYENEEDLFDITPYLSAFNLCNYDGESINIYESDVYDKYNLNRDNFENILKKAQKIFLQYDSKLDKDERDTRNEQEDEVRANRIDTEKFEKARKKIDSFIAGMPKRLKNIYEEYKNQDFINGFLKNVKDTNLNNITEKSIIGSINENNLINTNQITNEQDYDNDGSNKFSEEIQNRKFITNENEFTKEKEEEYNKIVNFHLKTFGKFSIEELLKFWISHKEEIKYAQKSNKVNRNLNPDKEVAKPKNLNNVKNNKAVTAFYEDPSEGMKKFIDFPSKKFILIKNDY